MPAKQLTPAQSAKPFTGKKETPAAAKKAADAAPKQDEAAPPADMVAKEDLTKALENIEMKMKAMYAHSYARIVN